MNINTNYNNPAFTSVFVPKSYRDLGRMKLSELLDCTGSKVTHFPMSDIENIRAVLKPEQIGFKDYKHGFRFIGKTQAQEAHLAEVFRKKNIPYGVQDDFPRKGFDKTV